MNILKINGTAISGIYVDAAVSFNKPAKRVQSISVPGRNGNLVVDEGTFDNVLISYPVYEKNSFPMEFDSIVNWLASLDGYQRIECSNDPTHFRLGRFVVPENPTAKRLNRDGYYQLSFDCKPQRYLNLGEVPTEIDANPSETYGPADIVSFEAAQEDTISGATFAITPVQEGAGDPSPTNVRPIIGWDKAQILQSQLADIAAANGRLIFPWKDGNTEYNPEMNLCHESDELLEDGESIHGAFFEWDKTMPLGVPYDPPEAVYYFDGTEGAGTFHISIGMAYGDGWKTTKHIQFTLNVAPAEGDQLVINCGTNTANDPTNGRTWNLYAKGSTISKDTGTTSDGTGGTNLGSTDSTDVGKANGRVNAPQRIVYGYNRWSQSFLRQYLNATAETSWYTAANPWDRPDASIIAKAGFLFGYGAEVYNYFKPIKVVTVACNADSNAEDVTYDRVFLSSLEQMYCVPQFAGKEGSYWEYYKRLLGRTTPAPTSATYARLIKYALNAATSARNCWRRSASRSNATYAWIVTTGGYVGTYGACYVDRCAPSVFISAEDIKITDITWQDTAGTVYGGTLEYLGGDAWRLKKTHESVDLGSLDWGGTAPVFTSMTSFGSKDERGLPFISSQYVNSGVTSSVNMPDFTAQIMNSGSGYSLWVKDPTYSDAVTFKTAMSGVQLVYELATPVVYDLTGEELARLVGQNNIFANCGQSTVVITEPTYFVNPGYFTSKPIIRVYGDGTFRVGDNIITIAAHTQPYIDIDSELQDCYCGDTNMNEYVTFTSGNYPELAPGSTYVLMGEGITKLIITPNWWEL